MTTTRSRSVHHPRAIMMPLGRVILLLLGGAVLAPIPEFTASAGAVNNPNPCVAAKNTCAAKAFWCLMKESNKEVQGQPSHPEKCVTTLTSCLERASAADHRCPQTSGCAPIPERVQDAASGIIMALKPVPPTTEPETRCVVRKTRAAGQYVRCIAAKPFRFESTYAGRRSCVSKLTATFSHAESRGGCLTTGDTAIVVDLASPAGRNLAGANLRFKLLLQSDLGGADLVDADLSDALLEGVDFRDACLTGVNFAGAHVSADRWLRTTCPDDSHSDTNGSDPESCCAHMGSAPPSSCSY